MEWDRRHGHPLETPAAHNNEPSPDRRLRIGYVSADFRRHVVGYQLLPLLREHDRRHFEVFCYSHLQRGDDVTEKVRSLSDHWQNIARLGDEEAEAMIRADGIDILVDLALHTARNRLPLFARKPAPVQVSYLGYCGTTGLEAIDYRLSDAYLDPAECDPACYREETVRLPHCYWCYQPGGVTPSPGPLPAARVGWYVTFGCLNNFAKVSAPALELWAEIMGEVRGSRLLLHAPTGASQRDVIERFASRNVSRERLEFVWRQPWERIHSKPDPDRSRPRSFSVRRRDYDLRRTLDGSAGRLAIGAHCSRTRRPEHPRESWLGGSCWGKSARVLRHCRFTFAGSGAARGLAFHVARADGAGRRCAMRPVLRGRSRAFIGRSGADVASNALRDSGPLLRP